MQVHAKRAQPSGARFLFPSVLARGLGVMALISTVVTLGAAVGQTGYRPGHEPRASTQQDRVSADRELAGMARDIDRASVGETRVAIFLGEEFRMSAPGILAERRDLGASWGDLTIAHTLAASDKQGMSPAQVLQLHVRGMGWGAVAAGLRFRLDDAIRAVRDESRVARGLVKADGKTPSIGGDGF
jgi:hypothetical protein